MEICSEVVRLYQHATSNSTFGHLQEGNKAQPISACHVYEAALIISYLFPPRRQLTVLKLLAALNLLNAAVKQSAYKSAISYKYVKGMCSYLLYSLLVRPVRGIGLWLDRDQGVTYFRVMGVQFSFHFVPMFRQLREELSAARLTPQTWDGMRLQLIAVEVLRLAQPTPFLRPPHHTPALSTDTLSVEPARVMRLIRGRFTGTKVYSQPYTAWQSCPPTETRPPSFVEDRITSLYTAITFNMLDENRFMLYRRKDRRPLRIIRYNGDNYDELLDYLMVSNKRVWRRRRVTLEEGKLYCLSPQQRIRTLSPASQLLAKTRNSYLIRNGLYNNLCLSYHIACYLARQYPSIRFVKTLNYNRLAVQHTFYDLRRLQKVPLGSIARRAKVWVVVDPERELADFELDMLPQPLIDDYLDTDDFYKEFQIVRRNGLKGVRAWHYHWLVPPLFPDIRVRNYHALVMGFNHKWAVFSLCRECFLSRFIYDSVTYDRDHGCIYGFCGDSRHIIARFNYNEF